VVDILSLIEEFKRFLELFKDSSGIVDIQTFLKRVFTEDPLEVELAIGTLKEAGLKILATKEGLELLKTIYQIN